MDNKEIYDILQEMVQVDKIKNSLEDLYLFLHEIENIIQNNNEINETEEGYNEYRYKLQIIEQQIAEIDEFLQKNNENNINYNVYLS